MASKMRIDKGRKSLRMIWADMPMAERLLVCIPLAISVVLVAWLVITLATGTTATSGQATRELLLTTDGHWETFENYGISVWCPNKLTEETPTGDYADYQRLFVTRDKGKFPEIAFGVIAVPDELANGRTFDLDNDPAGVLDVTTPLINSAFGAMINGAYPTTSIEIEQVTLASGSTAIVGSGEAIVTLVLQDPEDPENPYAEETTTNIYYSIVMYGGRPIIVWGTWDYSTYEGQERTIAAVTDGVVSVMRADGSDVIEPVGDVWVDTQPVYDAVDGGEASGPATWDEEQEVWIDDETGEVRDDLPHIDDPYWDEHSATEPADELITEDISVISTEEGEE